jgi:hypothetical protein
VNSIEIIDIYKLINKVYVRKHIEQMEKKLHNSYCIVNRFLEYFEQEVEIDDLTACKRPFGCDFIDYDGNFMKADEYNKLSKQTCTYYNLSYREFVEKNSLKDLCSYCDFKEICAFDESYSLLELMNENYIKNMPNDMWEVVNNFSV